MPFVIDTSATMPWCFPDEQSPQSEALLDRLVADSAHAPALWGLEVVNTLMVAERKRRISGETADAFIARLRRFNIKVEHDDESRAFSAVMKLCRTRDLTAYDAAYLELAMRLNIPLATRDEALKRAATQAGVTLIPA